MAFLAFSEPKQLHANAIVATETKLLKRSIADPGASLSLLCQLLYYFCLTTVRVSPTSRPKVLLLHLKRFDNALGKNTSRVFFPATLIKEAIPAEDNELELNSSDYSLMSVVHHIGISPGSGHYTADALRPVDDCKETERAWFNFDDSITAHQETKKITEDSLRQQTAYILLYSRVDNDSNKSGE
jgi:hypothetical protein